MERLDWARVKFGYNISAVSLGSKAPLVKDLDNLSVAGRICVDPESLGTLDPFEFLGEIPSHRGRLRDENIHLLILVTTDEGVSTPDSSDQYWKNASGTILEKDSAAQLQLRRWLSVQQL